MDTEAKAREIVELLVSSMIHRRRLFHKFVFRYMTAMAMYVYQGERDTPITTVFPRVVEYKEKHWLRYRLCAIVRKIQGS